MNELNVIVSMKSSNLQAMVRAKRRHWALDVILNSPEHMAKIKQIDVAKIRKS